MKKQKNIIISIHDISPIFKKELKIIFDYLNRMKIKEKEAFVILNWLGEHPLENDKKFIKELKTEFSSAQINFHGMTHYSQDQSLIKRFLFGKEHAYGGEFTKKNTKQIEQIFKSSFIIFKRIFNKHPKNFIAPRWENSNELLEVCKKMKIDYAEAPFHLINLRKDKKKPSLVLCFDYGSNKLLNYLPRIYAPVFVFLSSLFNLPLRFSIHPNDVKNGNIEFEMNLLKKLLNNGWKPCTTKDFWEKKK